MANAAKRFEHLLLEILDQGYERSAWHGPNLKQSLRGVSARAAAWRPSPRRHNIWEIAMHAAYWKYAVRRRITGGKRGGFAREGSNWLTRPARLTQTAWRADQRLLADEHRKLRAAVTEALRAGQKLPLPMIWGVAFHDVYHAGQIRLLRRLRDVRR
jgi:hypothetical protein